jgi:DNA-binding transcriptional MocR family regulator
LHGLEAVEVPMREDGMDLDHLERVLGGELPRRPRLVYTMPNFHNPTGITTDQPHRERLLLLCERHGVPVVEDGFEEEMKYTGRGVLPLKSMDSRGVVFYVGTFSKVVFPGLRVGWIVAPEPAVSLLTNILQVSSVAGNTLAQAEARFCAGGGFEAYLLDGVPTARVGARLSLWCERG